MSSPPSSAVHFDVREDILSARRTPSLCQLTATPEDPYVQVVRAAQSDTTLTPPLPTQSAPTLITDPTQSTPLTQTPTGRRTARMSVRVRGYPLRLSLLPSSPPKRTRSVYMGTSTTPLSLSPASSPTHSPPRQRLRRADDSYSVGEDDPEEESEDDPEEDPEEDQEEPIPEEPTPIETTSADQPQQAMVVGTVTETPMGLDTDTAPTTFEIGQSSRPAQIQGPEDDVQWRDIECVVSTAIRVESPDYTPSSPSFVPPSPSPLVSPLSAASPAAEEENTIEQILIQMASHASLLDVHTDQLERLRPARFHEYEHEIARLDRSTSLLSREFTGMHRRMEDFDRTQWLARDHARAAWQRLTAAEAQIVVLLRAGQEDRRRIEDLEASLRDLTREVERLRRERDQA